MMRTTDIRRSLSLRPAAGGGSRGKGMPGVKGSFPGAVVCGRGKRDLRPAVVVFVLLAMLVSTIVPLGPGPSVAHAQDSGGTDSVFRLGPTARGVGLSAAMVGLALDASAPYWNPALLAHVPGSQLTLSFNRLYSIDDGAAYQYVGLVIPTLHAGGFGVGLMRLSLGGIDTYDASSRPTGSIDYAETQMLFSYGWGTRMPLIGGRIDLGLSAKIHSLELSERSTSGGMDGAVAWQPPHLDAFRLTWVSQNLIAPAFRLVEMEDEEPSTQRFAVSFHRRLGEPTTLALAVDYDLPELADARLAVGGEFAYRGLYTVRAGYDSERFSVGLGGRWRAYALDYAFRSGGELGASQFLTFTWHFGESIQERRLENERQRQLELQQARMEAVEKWRRQEATRALDEVRVRLDRGELDTAEESLARARGLGADEDLLAPLQEELGRLQEQRRQNEVADELHRSQVRQAEQAVRSALAEGDPPAARLALQQLQRIAPDHPMLPRLSAEVDDLLAGAIARAQAEATAAEQDGDWETALRAWGEVARLDPADPGPAAAQARWQAQLEAARHDSEQARAQAAQARRQLVQEQRYTQALEDFAQGEFDTAAALCNEVLQVQPGHAGARELLRRIELRRRQPRQLSPQEAEAVRNFYLAGLTRFTDGDYEGAISQWEKILQIDPGNQGARNNIDEARARLKSLHRGEEQREGEPR